jgi:hypothetical protein
VISLAWLAVLIPFLDGYGLVNMVLIGLVNMVLIGLVNMVLIAALGLRLSQGLKTRRA